MPLESNAFDNAGVTLKAVDTSEHRLERSGRYKLLAQIGHGGMAKVYLAVARGPSNFNKLVVVKALREDLQEDPGFLEMFLDEARLAARLNHPNVVQTYEVVEDGGRNLIVMEYLEGQPLSAILGRSTAQGASSLPLAMGLKVLVDTLAGLHYAHDLTDFDGSSLGLVHRDVSPQNVFVTFDGQVKVLDFGIAKAANMSSATRSGVLKGKVKYMAPEQMSGDPIDRRADIYAVGVMLWEILVGGPRWQGKSDIVIMNNVLNQDVQAPKELNPAISDNLSAICMKTLARDPKDRYQTAAELEMALESEIQNLTISVKQRDIAKIVAEMFADLRAQTKALIEVQLSKAAAHSSSELTPIALPMGTTTLSSTGSSTAGRANVNGNGSAVPQYAAAAESPKTKRGAWIALAVLFLLGGAFVVVRSGRAHEASSPQAAQSEAPTAAVPAPPDTSAAPAPPAIGALTIAAVPPDAKLFFDDAPLASNPATKTLPLDGSPHTIRAEAKGYVTRSLPLVARTNETFELALEREQPKHGGAPEPRHKATPSVSPTTPPHPAPTATAAPAGPNCDQPFFIDERGIKVFKPECMK